VDAGQLLLAESCLADLNIEQSSSVATLYMYCTYVCAVRWVLSEKIE
jgi:hypothetical protein